MSDSYILKETFELSCQLVQKEYFFCLKYAWKLISAFDSNISIMLSIRLRPCSDFKEASSYFPLKCDSDLMCSSSSNQ